MKIERKKIILNPPLPIPNGVIKDREFNIYKYENIQFELSPLPGLSHETLIQAEEQLFPYLEKIKMVRSYNHYDLRKPLFNLIHFKEDIFPSVLFSLEQFLFRKLKLEFQEQQISCHHFIPDLYDMSLLNKDIEYVKIKINKYTVEEEVKKLRKIVSNNKKIRLRLDANQSLDEKSILPYLEFINNIDYFEEPFKNITNYSGEVLPIAIDENIPQILSLIDNKSLNIKAIIYKPTIMGGISTAISLRLAPQLVKIPLILSSSYEGCVGSNYLIDLAGYIDFIGPKARHGLVSIE
jgi:o-succinylbenzoate synthase